MEQVLFHMQTLFEECRCHLAYTALTLQVCTQMSGLVPTTIVTASTLSIARVILWSHSWVYLLITGMLVLIVLTL